MSSGTSTALGVGVKNHHRCWVPADGKTFLIGGWIIKPVPLEHDASEPWGFIVFNVDENERLLFIPDTAYVKNRFDRVTVISIECNHISDILHDKIISGALPAAVGHRVRRNHMSLDTVIEMLKSNDLSKCREIWLLHLSDGNSHEARMIRAVQEATGIPCRAAQ